VAVIVWIFWRSRRNAVHARNAIVEVDAAGFAVRGRKATKAARKAREAA
jgi:PiT family inorganic phosphate transporter